MYVCVFVYGCVGSLDKARQHMPWPLGFRKREEHRFTSQFGVWIGVRHGEGMAVCNTAITRRV